MKKSPLIKLHRATNNLTGIINLYNQICELTECSMEDIGSKSRKQKLVFTRAAFAVLAKEQYPDLSLELIGSMMNRDHSSVTVMIQQVKDVKEKREFFFKIQKELQIKHLDYSI
jgi:chromosomal replication initiation ATPase DnaA